LIAITLFCTPVAAQPPATKEEAKQHYIAGERAFRLGEFDKAIQEWRISYEISGEPVLLYNLGLAARQSGDLKQAGFYLRQFLATGSGDETQRATARQKLDELQAIPPSPAPAPATSSTPAQEPAPPSTPPPPAPKPAPTRKPAEPSYRSPLAWALTIGGLALTAAGGGLLGDASTIDLHSAMTLDDLDSLQGQRSTDRIAGGVLLGVGVAALAGGAAVFVISAKRAHTQKLEHHAAALPYIGGSWTSLGGAR
jgi:hypothetical protein